MFPAFSSQKKSSSKKVRRTKGERKASYSRRFAIEPLESRRMLAVSLVREYALPVGGSGDQVAYDMTQDGSGNTYVVGVGNNTAFLNKYTPGGNLAWSQSLNGIAAVSAFTTVSVDSLGNVFAGGYFSGGDTFTYTDAWNNGVVLKYRQDSPINLNLVEHALFSTMLSRLTKSLPMARAAFM